MELILLQDVEKVGRKGEVVRVREGFGRNFLLARRLALVASKANEKFVQELGVRAAKRHEKEKGLAEKRAEALNQLKLTIEAQAGEGDKLYGSVTSEDIRAALEANGHVLDKKQVHLPEHIRTLGLHTVTVELYPQIKASVAVEVIRKA